MKHITQTNTVYFKITLIINLLNILFSYDLNFFIIVAYTIFQAHVMHVTLKIALNIQVNVSNKPCLYLFACWHKFVNFLNKFYLV